MNIRQWLEKTKQAYSFIQQKYTIIKQIRIITPEEKQQLLEEFKDSKYTLAQIPDYISKCNRKYIYTAGQLRIHILCQRMTKKIENQVRLSLYRGNAIYKLFGLHVTTMFHKHYIDIVLLPIQEPRKKPIAGEKIEPMHVNGGYTYLTDHTIYIYRLEEWPKVMLHELLHNVPSLQNIAWKPDHIKQLYEEFRIDMSGCPTDCKTILEPTEAIIETWAIFLHTVFVSLETLSRDFTRLLAEEIKWNDQQVAWILKKRHENHDGIWRENTHAFSYLVLRCILFHHLDDFLKMKLPYSGNILTDFIIKKWKSVQIEIIKLPYKKQNSLRMSRFGNL